MSMRHFGSRTRSQLASSNLQLFLNKGIKKFNATQAMAPYTGFTGTLPQPTARLWHSAILVFERRIGSRRNALSIARVSRQGYAQHHLAWSLSAGDIIHRRNLPRSYSFRGRRRREAWLADLDL